MIDPPPYGRIDLRAVDGPRDPGRADRIVASVLDHVVRHDLLRSVDLLTRLGRLLRPAIAVAAVVILCATAILRWMDERGTGTPVGSLSAWTEAGRVPTNGELLAAFKGYGR
jgi:hypothetical protein